MGRIQRSWQLAKASWAVLSSDRELLVFPAISFVALVAVLITFLPIAIFGRLVDLETREYTPAAVVVGFAFYVLSYTVTFYFNTALVGAAMIRLGGGDPTVRDGLSIATSRLPQIVGYALIAATVGMVLRMISERAGIIGQIIVGLIGLAWSILTFLVVPVLAAEGVGPIAAIRRSGELLRKTWGEQIIGGGGIGLVFGLLMVLVLFVGVTLTFVFAPISGYFAAALVVATILAVGAIALVSSALGGIYTASLYRYATSGETGAFGTDVLSAAFEPKTKRGLFGR